MSKNTAPIFTPPTIVLFFCCVEKFKFSLPDNTFLSQKRTLMCTNRSMSSVTDMLEELNWESLESRRTKIQLTLLYKIMNGMVDIPTSPYVTQASARTRSSHTMKLRQISSRTDAYKYSFFPRTIPFWNSLPASIAEAPDLVSFKRELSTLTF